MKRNYTILLLLFCLKMQAQWAVQTAPVTTENRCIFMTSSLTGYIVGSSGNMFKTTDAGVNWNTVANGTVDTLRSVFFINDTTGFISGANGTIRRTDDAGTTWVAQTSGTTQLIRSIFFVNDDIGYACCGGGVILKTLNGGLNWSTQVSGVTQDLINIRFLNADTGYCVSSSSTFLNGIVLKTTDGGLNWTSVYTNTYGLLGLAVVDETIFAGGGYETIVKSDDGGSTWTQLNSNPSVANHFRSASFLNPDTGYVVGDSGKIFYTKNGGVNWTNQAINASGVLSVFTINEDTAYACGALGNILRYVRPCYPDPATAIIGSVTVCANDTEIYYVNAVPNTDYYNWQVPLSSTILSGQGDTLIVLQLGSTPGMLSVLDSNLCGNSAMTAINLNVQAAPAVPVVTQSFNVLNSGSPVGNQWFLNGVAISGATSQTYVANQNGTYTVSVSFANGCSRSSLPFIVMNAGVPEVKDQFQFSIVPNPVNQLTYISFEITNPAMVTIEAFNLIGSRVSTIIDHEKMQGFIKQNFNCSNWSSGTYFIKAQIGEDVVYKKLVKE
jgi:photosystem II stability/assembly factor-like uncharacterized protein